MKSSNISVIQMLEITSLVLKGRSVRNIKNSVNIYQVLHFK